MSGNTAVNQVARVLNEGASGLSLPIADTRLGTVEMPPVPHSRASNSIVDINRELTFPNRSVAELDSTAISQVGSNLDLSGIGHAVRDLRSDLSSFGTKKCFEVLNDGLSHIRDGALNLSPTTSLRGASEALGGAYGLVHGIVGQGFSYLGMTALASGMDFWDKGGTANQIIGGTLLAVGGVSTVIGMGAQAMALGYAAVGKLVPDLARGIVDRLPQISDTAIALGKETATWASELARKAWKWAGDWASKQ